MPSAHLEIDCSWNLVSCCKACFNIIIQFFSCNYKVSFESISWLLSLPLSSKLGTSKCMVSTKKYETMTELCEFPQPEVVTKYLPEKTGGIEWIGYSHIVMNWGAEWWGIWKMIQAGYTYCPINLTHVHIPIIYIYLYQYVLG